MFRGAQTNPYDAIVAKTTDENLTSENWELILNLCDKVTDEGEQGARNVIAALLKRLTHRNANVQLYSLALADSLSKNCGIQVHREMASRAFTQSLEKIIADRTTHEKVRQKALSLIATWTAEFENDPTLGIMEECYNNLRTKNYKFQAPQEAPPPDVDDAARRREEEELQKVLEMSVHDKGGRTQWSDYSAYAPSSGAGSSSSGAGSSSRPAAAATSHRYSPPPASSGYVPAQAGPPRADAYTPAPAPVPAPATPAASSYTPAAPATMPIPTPAPESAAQPAADAPIPIVTRVRALHSFEPTEAGELAFEKGDIIKVVDRGYKDWWRGQLKGRTGIFPVNYVEPLPEPTAQQLAQEAQQEASVFSQAANVDKLLTLLREFDVNNDNLADNEEIQELYRNTISLRPKIVKLIDKYSQKRADLVSMNESFVKAKSIYERMMEQSLARIAESGQEGQMYRPAFPPYGPQPGPGGQQYGWNQGGYDQTAYQGYPQGGPPPQGQPPNQQPYQQPFGPQQPGAPYQQPYGSGTPVPQPTGTPAPFLHQQQPPVQPTATPVPHLQQAQPQAFPQAVAQPHADPQQQQSHYGQAQPQVQTQALPQTQSQPQGQAQPQAQTQQQSGPPWAYVPNGTYPDDNATAWARYYSQGGTDPTGAAYFISVPGVKEAAGSPATPGPATTQQIDPNAAAHRQNSADTVAPVAYQPQAQAQPEPQTNPVQQPLQRHDTVGSVASVATVTGYPAQPQPQPGFPQDPASQFTNPSQPWPAASSSPTVGAFQHPIPSTQQSPPAMPSAAPGPYANPAGGAGAAVYPPAGPEPATHGGAPQWGGQYQGLPNAMASMSLGPTQEAQPSTA